MKQLSLLSLLIGLTACTPAEPISAPVAAAPVAVPAPAPSPNAAPAAAAAKPDKSRIAVLVEDWQRAWNLKENPPSQRFWVSINDQPANPWNTRSGKAMTWKLREVRGPICLVGNDTTTNAYEGDTPVEQVLPMLCIRRTRLQAPEGVDPSNFYAGWSGGEIRLSRPVPARELSSHGIADALARDEFGEGWRMAEFHDTSSGGWAFWAYWGSAPGRHQ